VQQKTSAAEALEAAGFHPGALTPSVLHGYRFGRFGLSYGKWLFKRRQVGE